MKECEICHRTEAIHVHHVVGRGFKNCNNEENLINLCWQHHKEWHEHRTEWLENEVYRIMKRKYGHKFPVLRNGKPVMTKWIMRIEYDNFR